MKLDLQFTSAPLEEIECDTIIVFDFQNAVEHINRTTGLDTNTWTMLAGLREKGFWSGTKGETLLIPGQNTIKAKKVLVKGLGDHAHYGRDVLVQGVREVADALDRMKVYDLAIQIPVTDGNGCKYYACMETACRQLLDSFVSRYKDERDFLLRTMVCLKVEFIHHLAKTVNKVKAHLNSTINYTIIFDRKDFVESSESALIGSQG